VQTVRVRYTGASRREKGSILDEVCRVCGYDRKYAIGLLAHPAVARTKPIVRPRARRYGEDVRRVLADLWEISDRLCGKRLAPFLPELIAALERHDHLHLAPATKDLLVAISPATADRLLASQRRQHAAHGLALTKPGTLLRQQIRVRTAFGWDEKAPGYLEVDLVAHCAENAAGDFLYTLTLTDIATGWTECQAILNRSQEAVINALEVVSKLLPFRIRGVDSDNGSEFINHLLKRYCDAHQIEFTRCRPYHKNDQCHVEQKNWNVVRRHIGYARYEGEEQRGLLQSVYRRLRMHVNFFQPSLKLKCKERHDARVCKSYYPAHTPYKRLLASRTLDEESAADLNEFYLGIDPLDTLEQMRDCIRRLQAHAQHHQCRSDA
jgi:hypothetical protein